MAKFSADAVATSRAPRFVRPAVERASSQPGATPETASPAGNLSFRVFCLLTFATLARPQDYFPPLEILRPGLTLTIISLLVTLVTGGASITRVFRHTTTKLYLFFFAMMVAGIPFSIHRAASFDFVWNAYFVNVIYFVLLLANVHSVDRLKRFLVVVAISALVFSVLALQFGSFSGGRYFARMGLSRRGRLIGLGFDPNDLAFVVVSLLGFSISVLLGVFGRFTKAVALASALFSIMLALFTGSRGGMIGFVVFVVFVLLIPLKGFSKKWKSALIVLVVGLAALNAEKINVDRYLTMTDLEDDYNTTEFGRMGIWTRGLQLFREHPWTGIGAACFGEGIGTLRKRERVIPRWQAPHNAFIQVLAELGGFAAATFLLLILITFKNLISAARTRAPSVHLESRTTAAILAVGFLALIVTAFFLSQGYSVLFTLLFAVAAAIKSIVGAQATVRETDMQPALPIASRSKHPSRFRPAKDLAR